MKDDVEALLNEGDHDELWLISYADLLTLLIGFFVLMLAMSPMKLSRFEQLAAALSGEGAPPLVELRQKVDALVAQSQLEGKVSTREDAEGLGIELKDALLFDSGSAVVRGEGRTVIAKVAHLVRELGDRPVIIEGHTDDVPIQNAEFGSNWELSSQRAINVLAELERSGVPRSRLSIGGYADTRALLTEGSVDSRRAANRRVVIRVE